MKIITLAAQKGGAGKSTLAAFLAVAAAQEGLRVIVLDFPTRRALLGAGARSARPTT